MIEDHPLSAPACEVQCGRGDRSRWGAGRYRRGRVVPRWGPGVVVGDRVVRGGGSGGRRGSQCRKRRYGGDKGASTSFLLIARNTKSNLTGMVLNHIGITWPSPMINLNTLSLRRPGYVPAAPLKWCNVHLRGKPTHSPSLFVPVTYGRKEQLETVDDSPLLSASNTKFILEVIGVFLFYSRAVDGVALCLPV